MNLDETQQIEDAERGSLVAGTLVFNSQADNGKLSPRKEAQTFVVNNTICESPSLLDSGKKLKQPRISDYCLKYTRKEKQSGGEKTSENEESTVVLPLFLNTLNKIGRSEKSDICVLQKVLFHVILFRRVKVFLTHFI